MAKYLVTGAAGFIGSSLVRALLERGDEVRGIDNLSTGRRENLTEVLKRVEFDFREADILDLDAMHKACAGVDYVLHQAAIPSVPKSVLDPTRQQPRQCRRHGQCSGCGARRESEAGCVCRLILGVWGHADASKA